MTLEEFIKFDSCASTMTNAKSTVSFNMDSIHDKFYSNKIKNLGFDKTYYDIYNRMNF